MTESDFHAEVRRMLLTATHLNEQLEALAVNFIDMHEPTTDYEVDELRRVIFDEPTPDNYAACLVRIMNHKYPVELKEEVEE